VQALVFSVAHVGITNSSVSLLFLAAFVFPLGLLGGHRMRATNSVIAPGIFHGALDIAIHVTFLSYAA